MDLVVPRPKDAQLQVGVRSILNKLFRNKDGHDPRQGMTLIEILVVITIIVILIGLLYPAVQMVRSAAAKSSTRQTIQALHQALETWRLHLGSYPMPDGAAVGTPRVGFLMASRNLVAPRLLDSLREKELFTWADEEVDSAGYLLDHWGQPYRYVLGDNANKNDATRPKDTNKPKDGGLLPADTDWNREDKGGFPYLYSVGQSTKTTDWIYLTEGGGGL